MVTGPSSGIGRATALELANRGYHVVAAGRSQERTQPVVDQVNAQGGSAEFLQLDLASLASAREAGQRFASSGHTLDVLVNNAGVGGIRGTTRDGFEIHFGVNHLGHFMLTHHLRPAFRAGTRIVVVSSEVHRRAEGLDWDRVQQKSRFVGGFREYGISKLANILFARRLAQLHPEWNTYSLHPGTVDTNIFPAWARPFFRNKLTPEEGAETSVWCATAAELSEQSGLYYSRKKVWEPSSTAQDDDLAQELWARSEQWCGVGN
jgi:NAD(P)-dependent dehydrogenase (short-subunit alcohol dehydrogenase family)